jgi:hypothetical protein
VDHVWLTLGSLYQPFQSLVSLINHAQIVGKQQAVDIGQLVLDSVQEIMVAFAKQVL